MFEEKKKERTLSSTTQTLISITDQCGRWRPTVSTQFIALLSITARDRRSISIDRTKIHRFQRIERRRTNGDRFVFVVFAKRRFEFGSLFS